MQEHHVAVKKKKVLKFCQPCGELRVKDVKGQLEKLFNQDEILQPNSCAICYCLVDDADGGLDTETSSANRYADSANKSSAALESSENLELSWMDQSVVVEELPLDLFCADESQQNPSVTLSQPNQTIEVSENVEQGVESYGGYGNSQSELSYDGDDIEDSFQEQNELGEGPIINGSKVIVEEMELSNLRGSNVKHANDEGSYYGQNEMAKDTQCKLGETSGKPASRMDKDTKIQADGREKQSGLRRSGRKRFPPKRVSEESIRSKRVEIKESKSAGANVRKLNITPCSVPQLPVPDQPNQKTSQPYQCKFCSKAFSSQEECRSHVLQHLDIQEETYHQNLPVKGLPPGKRGDKQTKVNNKKFKQSLHVKGLAPGKRGDKRAKMKDKKLKQSLHVKGLPPGKQEDKQAKVKDQQFKEKQGVYHLVEQLKEKLVKEIADMLAPTKSTRRLYRCKICEDENFTYLCSFLSHMKTCHGYDKEHKKPWQCKWCSSQFKRKHLLLWHLCKENPNKQTVRCTFKDCGKTFDDLRQLHLHKRNIHRYVVCHICGKKLRDKSKLIVHLRGNHYKVRPFKCQYCPKTYIDAYSMKSHERIVHLKMKRTAKGYLDMCEYCGKSVDKLSTHFCLKKRSQMQTIRCTYDSECQFITWSESLLESHLKQHESNTAIVRIMDRPVCSCMLYSTMLSDEEKQAEDSNQVGLDVLEPRFISGATVICT